jgi:hypothetical protein
LFPFGRNPRQRIKSVSHPPEPALHGIAAENQAAADG